MAEPLSEPRLRGERCELHTAAGPRCLSRAYALVDVQGLGQRWACGNHQSVLRNGGVRVTLVRKWKAQQ